MSGICTECGTEFPSVKHTTCACGGDIIILDDPSPDQKQAYKALVPNANESTMQLLTTVVKVINGQETSETVARRAVGRVLAQYEEGLLTTLVGVARARTERLIKLMHGMSSVEDRLLLTENVNNLAPPQLLKLYRTLQFSFTGDIALLTNVTEMRSRIEAMMAQGLPLTRPQEVLDEELTQALPPARRERLRNVLNNVIRGAQLGDTHDD